jgi:hypothetical protein
MAGSLTKEYPLADVDRTILAIRPGWTCGQVRQFAAAQTNSAIPALLRQRYLLVEDTGEIRYDRFLSLANSEGINTPRVRKVMYFTQFFRDQRLRRFVCEVVADPNGLWRISHLTRKQNASFFREFFKGEAAQKARSNVEYFLVEAGIVDLNASQVHLELEDGWLAEAMQVAAQHVHNAAVRRAMTSAPMDYLIAHRLNGLANATSEGLLGIAGRVGNEAEPAEDEGIRTVPDAMVEGRSWNRPEPTPAQQQAAAAISDPVARERASRAHHRLERLVVEAARAQGHDPKYTALVDLYFGPETRRVLCEMKSCTQGNVRSQVRRGVSQLFEYRYLYRGLLGDAPTLLLVLEIKPSGHHTWLIDYLYSVGVIAAWKDPGADRIVSSVQVPASLAGVVSA